MVASKYIKGVGSKKAMERLCEKAKNNSAEAEACVLASRSCEESHETSGEQSVWRSGDGANEAMERKKRRIEKKRRSDGAKKEN